jgi:hypothetical protein
VPALAAPATAKDKAADPTKTGTQRVTMDFNIRDYLLADFGPGAFPEPSCLAGIEAEG